ncbi:hypothetical protein LTR62_003552 [Meristemomyces frigidus]|uniref:Major facilitator superfamily (MFS) profile domain-containing protein n=1 Tax=Meristemomyces frigidus TaxID=1508187 RepID=A0AAN7TJZ6_9PEZI|nr:hypothetical protein LTR62_003552 [Meristemomyces frigidus]
MAAAMTSTKSSPTESTKSRIFEDEKGREEVEDDNLGREDEEVEISQPKPYLQMQRTRSAAQSTRSQDSHTDGYTYSPHHSADGEKQGRNPSSPPAGDEIDPEKEFEVQFDGDADPLSPRNKSNARKWLIVIILAASSLCVTCASASYTSTYPQMEREFHVSRELATVGLTTYVCGLGLGPMWCVSSWVLG